VPIYEYACTECDHSLDALQKMSDDPLLDCPECGEPALKRLLSAPRFSEGWYETDFKKDNQKNVHKSDSEPAKSDGDKKPDKSTADKKSESKPKPKPKPKPKVKSED
jgi:putative FmdB family regulatory protein